LFFGPSYIFTGRFLAYAAITIHIQTDSIPVKDVTSLLYFCVCVLLLSLSGFLIAMQGPKGTKNS
jgi:hypothetical protein